MERRNSRGAERERRPSRGASRGADGEDSSWNNNPIAGDGMRGGGARSAERPRKHTSMQPQRSTERLDRPQRRPSAPSSSAGSQQQARRTARKKEADDNIKVVV